MASLSLLPLILCMTCLKIQVGLTLTVEIGPGREDCYFEEVGMNQTFSVDYVVIHASHQGAEDIDFKLTGPRNTLMQKDRRESDGAYSFSPAIVGQYKICFDNTFSHLSTKKVSFEVAAVDETEEDARWNDDEDTNIKKYFFPEDPNQSHTADVKRITNRVRINMLYMQRVQREFRGTELKDHKIAQKKNWRVGFWSCVNLIILILVGLLQVIMVKSLFDGKYKIQNLLLKFKKFIESFCH